MLGFTAGVDVYMSVSDVMYFGTQAFAANTVQPSLHNELYAHSRGCLCDAEDVDKKIELFGMGRYLYLPL